jgi:hypothetical protein
MWAEDRPRLSLFPRRAIRRFFDRRRGFQPRSWNNDSVPVVIQPILPVMTRRHGPLEIAAEERAKTVH